MLIWCLAAGQCWRSLHLRAVLHLLLAVACLLLMDQELAAGPAQIKTKYWKSCMHALLEGMHPVTTYSCLFGRWSTSKLWCHSSTVEQTCPSADCDQPCASPLFLFPSKTAKQSKAEQSKAKQSEAKRHKRRKAERKKSMSGRKQIDAQGTSLLHQDFVQADREIVWPHLEQARADWQGTHTQVDRDEARCVQALTCWTLSLQICRLCTQFCHS